MSTMITDLINSLDTTLKNFVHNGYTALLSSDMKWAMTAVITLYIAWIGWKTLNQWQGFSAGQFVKDVLKIAVVYSIATDWEFFSTYIYNVLTNAPAELAAALMTSAKGAYDPSYAALQKAFDKGVELGCKMWSMGGWTVILPYVLGLNIWIVIGALTGVAIILICVAKSFLALLLVLTPVFVYFILSDMLKGITEFWFKLTLGFAFVPLMVNIALLFTNAIMDDTIGKVDAVINMETWPKDKDALIMPIMIGFNIWIIMCTILVFKSAALAAQIGGGLAVTGLEQIPAIAGGVAKFVKAISDSQKGKGGGKSSKNQDSSSRWNPSGEGGNQGGGKSKGNNGKAIQSRKNKISKQSSSKELAPWKP